jgi:hypothetical protein
MRILAFFVLALALPMPAALSADQEPERAAFVEESRAKVKAFASSLKGELQAAIQAGGPVHAIPVCNAEAPKIARALSQSPEWTVGRTSHKLRNPDNAPDDWEAAGLDEFLARAAEGESLTAMERVALVEGDGGRAYRYMKAIPVGEVCLTCHGAEIDPEVKAEIETFYPEDRATGFALGELRGAFTITKTLGD